MFIVMDDLSVSEVVLNESEVFYSASRSTKAVEFKITGIARNRFTGMPNLS